jgi:hypothetical protein
MFAFVVIYRCTLADSVLCVVSSKRFAELVIRVTATEDDTQAQRITDSDGNGGWRFKCVSIGCNNRGAERASTKVVAVQTLSQHLGRVHGIGARYVCL